MHTYLSFRILLILAITLSAGLAWSGDKATEASRLGGPELTPVGAERAENAAGTIPPWTGGIVSPPDNYKPGMRHPDPFPDDSIAFTISAANLEDYAQHLSEGQKALLRAYPETWRMNVYPTRRSASYPDWVYEAIKSNAASSRLILEGKGGVESSNVSSPFPIPRNGVEIIWNHNLRWRGIRVSRFDGIAAVTRRGAYRVIVAEQEIGFPYGSRVDNSFRLRHPNLMLAVKAKIIQPQLLSGDGSLILEPLNQTHEPRKIWNYSRNLRRVFRSPHDAYDDPAPNSDGLRTIDELSLYNGAPDRYDWNLLGKKEIYIPYNAYRLHGSSLGFDEILQTGHINPDLARYELHRVWVVEGVLKEGARHLYSRRVFYIDEDSWQIAVADSFDEDGELWRYAEGHALNYYEVPVHWTTLEVFHDLRARRYLAQGLDNNLNVFSFSDTSDPREFSPIALQYYVR